MAENPQGRSPEHWRKMAAETRTIANGVSTEANRQQMLEVAKSYDRLAEEAEREQRPRV